MGFYLRKSVKVGPIRFNLSKSGIGVSGGVKGFRLGTGPRGNYVHMGRNGIYYRRTLSPGRGEADSTRVPRPLKQQPPDKEAQALEEIESAEVSQMRDASSADLLDELNQKSKTWSRWPLAALSILVVPGVAAGIHPLASIVTFLAAIAFTWQVAQQDQVRKTTVLMYDFDEQTERGYEGVHACSTQMANCGGVWHIEAEGSVLDPKYQAGASRLVRRRPTFIRKAEPPRLKTNVEIIALGVGRQTMYFFPDRLLVFDRERAGAVAYNDLRIEVAPVQFVEDGTVPRDAEVVGRTWKYVNKKGGPDRRFKDNRELPICLYEYVHFRSSSGLNEQIQLSRVGVAEKFAKALSQFAGGTSEATGDLLA